MVLENKEVLTKEKEFIQLYKKMFAFFYKVFVMKYDNLEILNESQDKNWEFTDNEVNSVDYIIQNQEYM